MASYHCHASIVKRSSGHSAVAAAAYRARTDLTDERTGQRHDYTRAYGGTDLAFSGIFAPEDAPAWAHDRAQLWNHVEAFENRKNAQLARDFDIALAHELTEEQNRWALQDWVKENFTRRGLVADVAIHRPHEWGDERNIHAHVMVTMRPLDGEEFARNKDREANRPEQLEAWRESWAQHLSRHLRRHGHDAEADRMAVGHLRLTEQREIAARRGDLALAAELDREPTVHMGKAAMAMERRGIETDRLNRQAEIVVTNEERAASRRAEHEAESLDTPAPEPPGFAHSAHGLTMRDPRLGKAWIDRELAGEALRGAWEQARGDAAQLAVNLGQEGYSLATSRYGRVVMVDADGTVQPVNSQTAGNAMPEISKAIARQFSADSPVQLLTVAEVRQTLRDERRAAWVAERQAEREKMRGEWIAARQEERAAAQEEWRGQAAAKLSGSPDIEAMREAWKWSDGNGAFLAALGEQGFAVGRITEQEAQDSRQRAEIARSHGHYSPQLEAGEFIAFNQHGRGYRLNGVTLDDAQAENRLQGYSEDMQTAAQALESVPAAPARSAEPTPAAGQDIAADAGRAGDKAAAISTRGVEGVARGIESALSGIADFLFGSSGKPQEPPTAPAAVHIPPSDAPAPSLARHVREVGKRAEKAGFSLDDAFAAYLVSHSQQLDPEITNTARRLREQQERDKRERDRDR